MPELKEWSDGGIAAVLQVNVGAAAALLLIYSIWQRKRANQAFYQPRALESSLGRPPQLDGWFGWITAPWNASEEDILLHSGLAAHLFLQFNRALLYYSLFVTFLSGCVILPLNASGHANRDNNKVTTNSYAPGFADWTVSNLETRDPKLWIHLGVLLFQAYGFYRLQGNQSSAHIPTSFVLILFWLGSFGLGLAWRAASCSFVQL